MPRAKLEALALRWMRFWQGHGVDDFDQVHFEDFIDHSASGRGERREDFKAGVAELYHAFPDFNAKIELIAVDDLQELVTIRWTATGRHVAHFLGSAPTGRSIAFAGIEIIRCENGHVVERWGEWDERAIADQLTGKDLDTAAVAP